MKLLLVDSLLDYGLDGVRPLLLLCFFAAVVELLDKTLQIDQVFQLVAHAPSPRSQNYVLTCLGLVRLWGFLLQVVNIENVEVVQELVELREDGGEGFDA